MRRAPQGLSGIFAMPIAIALSIIVGLIVALTGDGARDAVAWGTLAIPVGAVAWAMRRRRS